MQIFDLLRAEVVDRYTARFHWDAFGSHTFMMEFSDLQEGVEVGSKRAYDERGIEWLKDNLVFTGPFEVSKWVERAEIELRAFPDHWRKVPYVERVRILAVPEASTRRAMLESGEAHAAEIGLKDRPALFEKGFKLAPETSRGTLLITFGGNYWEWKHARTGEVLQRERDISKPWIGNPFENGETFDPNTPSMQRSKKVRWALSQSIDREALVDTILQGQGEADYTPHMFNDDPIWKKYQDKWTIPYDPEGARALLKEAGYERGFPVEIWTGPTGIGVELWEGVGNFWLSELNLRPEFDRSDYYVFRPTIVGRTSKKLYSGCCTNLGVWPLEWSLTSYNYPAGFNIGLELPKASENYIKKRQTTDPVETERLAVDTLDYYHEWMIFPGVVEWPDGAVYNPKLVEWEQMRPYQWSKFGGLRSFEWVRLK